MFSRINSFRFVAVLIAAFLVVTGLPSSASAATARTLSISASPVAGVAGTAVTFTGKLSRSPKGTVVIIQRKAGRTWVKAGATRTVNKAGNYAVRLARPKSVANYAYRATSLKKGNLRTATSRTITVAALTRTLTSLSTSATTTTAGSKVALSGTVLPFVRGTKVTLQRQVGSSWSNVTTTTVTSNGTFSKDVFPSTTTTYRALVSRTTRNAPAISNTRVVKAKPLIVTSILPAATRLGTYSATLTTFGNQVGTWTAAPLPSGLSLDAATGKITGSPTAVGDTNVTIGFTQRSTGLAASAKTLTLRVNQTAPPVITTTTLPAATRLSPYTTTLVAQGNPTGTWTASPLPAGLSINASTGVISGTPTAVGSTNVVIGFTETRTGLPAPTKTIALQVNQAAAPVIATTILDEASVGTAYSFTLTAQGNPPGTWTVSGRPAWLNLNASTGVLSGTPPIGSAGTDLNLVVGFTQTSTGVAAQQKTLTLRIDPGNNPVITTAALPNGTRLSAYSTQLTAQGNPDGTWTASPLPAGLTLNASTGVISGTPTAVGSTDVVIGFTRTSNGLAATPKTLTLQVLQAAAPVISTTSLPDGTRFQVYSTTLTATGNPAGTWTASPLPAGLSLNASTGVISGVPSAAGTTQVEVGFTQSNTGLEAAPKTLSLMIKEAPAPVISTANLPEGTRTLGYSTTLTAQGNPPGTWSASPLPAGLLLNTTTGVISGTPTAVGTTNVVIGFTQTSTGLAAEPKTLALVINEAPAPVITTTSLPSGTRLSAYSTTLAVTTAGSSAGTWSASPLPAGLSLNTTTGVISGTPTAVGTTNVVIGFTQTSTGLAAATKTLALVINEAPAPVITSPSTLPQTSPLAPYSYQLEVAGGVAGTWKVLSGAPIAGISVKPDGRVSGAAPLPGNSAFTVQFTDTRTGLTATKTFTLKCA